MRRISLLLVVLLTLFAAVLPVSADAFPDLISLPNGWRPEGVAVGKGHEIFSGSLGTGAVYRADLRTGEGSVVVPPQSGRVAVGLKLDERTNYLFVAGGPGGAGYVYDANTGASLATYQFATGQSFVNDVVVTKDAAWFTDSFRPVLYKVPLGNNGSLPDPSAVQTVALGGDYVFVAGAFNTNGIDATNNGKELIIVSSARAELLVVDPNTGNAKRIDLGGGSVPNGDGILLEGKTLYVVQNQRNQIAVIDLNSKLTSGKIVKIITDSDFQVPTTVARFGNSLYAVNARFGTPPTPDTTYAIVRVDK